jgi:hypothetical protein
MVPIINKSIILKLPKKGIEARNGLLKGMRVIAVAALLSSCVPTGAAVENDVLYAVECWEAGSAFADPSCSCLGKPAHKAFNSRPQITVVVGCWCVREGRMHLLRLLVGSGRRHW